MYCTVRCSPHSLCTTLLHTVIFHVCMRFATCMCSLPSAPLSMSREHHPPRSALTKGENADEMSLRLRFDRTLNTTNRALWAPASAIPELCSANSTAPSSLPRTSTSPGLGLSAFLLLAWFYALIAPSSGRRWKSQPSRATGYVVFVLQKDERWREIEIEIDR